ncbi:hypothetical protein Salat_1544600 [Sesamum alatum]|uniref:Uncharacterized protein n=1 Tax=Sesamum alatum TaxID=300844 RepID=A0AAE1YDD7_9LAMI|nr:hypothetical protein Salat_1544600 [Sesamum alatum]
MWTSAESDRLRTWKQSRNLPTYVIIDKRKGKRTAAQAEEKREVPPLEYMDANTSEKLINRAEHPMKEVHNDDDGGRKSVTAEIIVILIACRVWRSYMNQAKNLWKTAGRGK